MPLRTEDIRVGREYANEKGARRLVTARGPEFVNYVGQHDDDCVEYEITAGRGTGKKGQTTRNSFAKWAHREVPLK